MVAARIDGIVAAEANKAVIFRRGPSKLTQMLVWDLETDEVTPGQWLKGHVYTRRADLSPNGRYVVYHATNYANRVNNHPKLASQDSWMAGGWTAVSRPPYFTAIGLWFTGGAWNGGGIWESNERLALNNPPCSWLEAERVRSPVRARLLNWGGSEDEPLFSMLLKKRGWIEDEPLEVEVTNPGWRERAKQFLKNATEDGLGMASAQLLMDSIPRYAMKRPGKWHKPFPSGSLHRIDSFHSEEWSVCDSAGKASRGWKPRKWHPLFLDVDARGRPVFGEEGCLWKWDDFPNGQPRLVADLNTNKFEPVAPPDWALGW